MATPSETSPCLPAVCSLHSKMEVAAALHHTSGLRTSSTAAATQSVDFASAPVAVVGSLPPCEVFAAPVFDHVPVVREQVIVQAIPRCRWFTSSSCRVCWVRV